MNTIYFLRKYEEWLMRLVMAYITFNPKVTDLNLVQNLYLALLSRQKRFCSI